MADRVVEVKLRLVTDAYKREAEAAARATEKLNDRTEELDTDLKKIPPDAARAAAAMKLLGTETIGTGNYIKGIGDKSNALQVLETRIREAQSEVRRLGEEFVRTGSVDVWERLNKSDSNLRALTSMRKKVTEAVSDGASEGLTSAFSLRSPQMIAAVAAVGGAIALPLLAAIGGATAGVAGAGVAGLGIYGAVLGDPERFKAAWGAATSDLKRQFIDASAPFVGPTMLAIQSIGPTVRSWHIDETFAKAAQFVEPLVHGIEGFGTGVVRGVDALVDKGAPAVNALSDGMSRLGDAAGDALSSIAEGSEGGALALHDLFTVVSLTIEGFGHLLEGAEYAYQYLHDHPWSTAIMTGGVSLLIAYVGELDKTSGRLGTTELGLRKAAEEAGHAFDEQGNDLTALMQKVNATTVTYDNLVAAMVNKVFAATMGLDQATLHWNMSLTQLGETLNRHDHSIDIHTKKGQENVQAIYATVTANMQMYQSMIAAGASAAQAADAYNTNTRALEAQLRKAGLTKTEIDGLIGKYRDVPSQVNTQLALKGIEDAINNLSDLIAYINHIPTRKDIWFYTHTGTVGGKEGPGLYAQGGIRRAASGMLVPPRDPGTILMGEPQTGGEALIPLRGISQARAMELMQTAGAGYGLNVVPNRSRGGGGSGPSTVVVQATFVDPVDGTVTRRQIVTAAANRGQSVAQFLGVN